MWLNPSVSKISLRFPSHFAHNRSAFAEQTSTLHQSEPCPILTAEQIQPILPLAASSLVSVRAVCCMTNFGNLFFFPYFHVSKVHVLLSTGWADIATCMLLCSHIPDLRGGAEVRASHGPLLPA